MTMCTFVIKIIKLSNRNFFKQIQRVFPLLLPLLLLLVKDLITNEVAQHKGSEEECASQKTEILSYNLFPIPVVEFVFEK